MRCTCQSEEGGGVAFVSINRGLYAVDMVSVSVTHNKLGLASMPVCHYEGGLCVYKL